MTTFFIINHCHFFHVPYNLNKNSNNLISIIITWPHHYSNTQLMISIVSVEWHSSYGGPIIQMTINIFKVINIEYKNVRSRYFIKIHVNMTVMILYFFLPKVLIMIWFKAESGNGKYSVYFIISSILPAVSLFPSLGHTH